ncbi:MAG: glutathione-regulated potassium-efflux system protein [Candidatus Binatia bacterium]|nr:MAG: glutathione-regulated potassium-efflux system protein [Fimbriimonadales bacterium]GIW44855.1 MAG: glutathione-regulated potassium-efflux system protein [Candidatus Binatia bacterium]
MSEQFAVETLALVVASAAGVWLCVRLRLPVVLGYLLAGLVIGPHGLHIVGDSPGVRFLAELGVVFLLFTIGLDFSISTLWGARRAVFGAGALQVGLTTLVVASASLLAGMDFGAALLLGGAVSMSSTALVVKQLADQGELFTHHGRLVVGILLFQDLAALPFLVLVGLRADPVSVAGWEIAGRFLLVALAVVLVAFFGRAILHRLLGNVARMRSNELMLLTALLLALGTGFAARALGFSAPIGAFLVGMVLGETDFRHQIEDDVRPFRELLLGLFFVTVGMTVDTRLFPGAWPSVLASAALFTVGKALLVTIVGLLLRWSRTVNVRTAAILAHGGEFGLLLLTQAAHGGLLEQRVAQPLLGGLLLSMGLAPLLIGRNEMLGRRITRGRATSAELDQASWIQAESEQLENHVLLLGCGRVGRQVAAVLEAAGVPYVAFEADPTRFDEAKRRGHRVILADAGRLRLLDAAGVARAKLLVVTFSYPRLVDRIVRHARERNPGVPVVVSAKEESELPLLARAGVTAVFPENLAAGLALGNQALLLLGRSHEEAARVVSELRALLHPELAGHIGV